MTIRIKDLTIQSYRCFEGSYKQFEKYEARNNIMIKKLFEDTKNGTIKGFYLVSNTQFRAYHRSTKEPGKIQLSAGHYIEGELIPCYDVQLESFQDLTREGYEAGLYKTIA